MSVDDRSELMNARKKLEEQIEELEQLIKQECKEDKDIQRLQTIPGVGDKSLKRQRKKSKITKMVFMKCIET